MNEWANVIELVRSGKTADPLERRGYAQGQTIADHDEQDGYRDALRVLAGKKPIRKPQEIVSKSYREGWDRAVDESGVLV